jgi:hypothetical protein
MPEFQLYKKRNMSDFLNDTKQFVKLYGKNYLKNFFSINGSLLLIISVLYYFTFKDFFTGLMQPGVEPFWLENDNNLMTVIGLLGLMFIAIIIYAIFSVGLPLVYIREIGKGERKELIPSELLRSILQLSGRVILFGIISIFIFMPILLIVATLGAALSIVLIGIPILIIALPATMIWSLQSLIIYVYEDKGYFEAVSKGWKVLFANFWPVVGSSVIIYIFIMIIQSVFTMIPYMMMIGTYISSGANPETLSLPPIAIFMYVLGIVVGYTLANVFYIQQVLVYYSAEEGMENIHSISELETIGNNEA